MICYFLHNENGSANLSGYAFEYLVQSVASYLLLVTFFVDTSKKRIKMSMANNKKTLEMPVDKYNVVSRLSVVSAAQLDKCDVASGKFAWQTGEGRNFLLFMFYCIIQIKSF